MKCPVCQNEFNEHTGRRPKRFCSDTCKVKFFNAKKKEQPKIKITNLLMPNSSITNWQTGEVIKNDTDKVIDVTADLNKQRLAALEAELVSIPDKTKGLGMKRADYLEREIRKLKYKPQ